MLVTRAAQSPNFERLKARIESANRTDWGQPQDCDDRTDAGEWPNRASWRHTQMPDSPSGLLRSTILHNIGLQGTQEAAQAQRPA